MLKGCRSSSDDSKGYRIGRSEKLVYRTTVLGQQEFIYEIVHDTESDFSQESYVAKISFSALFARRQC